MARAAAVVLLVAGLAGAPLPAAVQDPASPAPASLADAIECRLTGDQYLAFGRTLDGKDGLMARQGWKKVESKNPFLAEYDLPDPITVAGTYTTRRIAFAADAILAVLDQPDPAVIAGAAHVDNAFPPILVDDRSRFRKFLGERVLSDVTDPPDGDNWRMRTTIALNVSNVDTDPDRTLYGCSYRMQILDKDGKPL